jgi:hypothetical protein
MVNNVKVKNNELFAIILFVNTIQASRLSISLRRGSSGIFQNEVEEI